MTGHAEGAAGLPCGGYSASELAASRREKRIRAAKREVRSELSVTGGDWTRRGYAADPSLLSTEGLRDELPRVDCRSMSREEFVARFEAPRVPCVVTGATEGWPAHRAWTLPELAKAYPGHRSATPPRSPLSPYPTTPSNSLWPPFLSLPASAARCPDAARRGGGRSG